MRSLNLAMNSAHPIPLLLGSKDLAVICTDRLNLMMSMTRGIKTSALHHHRHVSREHTSNKGCLDSTIRCASYQAAISNNGLSPAWMTMAPAQGCVLKENVNCNCVKTHCEGGLCSCRMSGLSCNDFCGHKNCKNYSVTDQEQWLWGRGGVDVDDDGADNIDDSSKMLVFCGIHLYHGVLNTIN